MQISKENHTHTAYSSSEARTSSSAYSNDTPIFIKLYDFYKSLYSALKLFPKRDRYSLGQRIDTTTIEVLESLFKLSVVDKPQKIEILQVISSKIDLTKLLLRLAHDNKSLTAKTYLSLQENLQEIGKMLGGWLKYLKHS